MLRYTREPQRVWRGGELGVPDPHQRNQPAGHAYVTGKFIDSILSGKVDLIARGPEGLNPVMIANAIMLSSFEDRTVSLPMDGDAYEKKLEALIASSTYQKPAAQAGGGLPPSTDR